MPGTTNTPRKAKAANRRARTNVKQEIRKLTSGQSKDATQSMKKIVSNLQRVPKAQTAKLSGSRVFQRLAEWIQQYIVLQDDTPPLPSPFQEKVQVHNLEYDIQLPALRYATPDGYYAFIIQPNIDKFIRIAQPGTSAAKLKDTVESSRTTHQADTGRTPKGFLLCSDKSWTCTDSSELAPILAAGTTVPATAWHWSDNRKSWVQGLKIYPMGSLLAGSEPIIYFRNTSSTSISAQSIIHFYDTGQSMIAQVTSAVTPVAADAGLNLPFTAGQWTAVMVPQYASAAFMSYGVILTTAAVEIPEMPQGMHIDLLQGATTFQFGAPLTWIDFSFFDVCAQDPLSTVALKAQYLLASHVKFGLFSTTVQNATAAIAKGGLIASAQFAGGTRSSSILKAPAVLFPFLASLPHDSSKAQLFDEGQHYFMKPEKIQDWMFKLVTDNEVISNYLQHDVPKIVTAIYSPPSFGTTTPVINIKGMAHFEYLTQDRSSVQWKASGDSLNQVNSLLAAIRTVPQFSENPKHLAKITGAIKSVVTSPMFISIAKQLGTMGLELLLV